MIFRVFTAVLLLVLVYWGLNSTARRFTLTRNQSRVLIVLGIFLTVIMVLIVTGRLPIQFIIAPIGIIATFLLRMLPSVLRLLPLWQMFKHRGGFQTRRQKADKDQSSVIRTEFLSMELHHHSGDMDGSVLKGSFKGKKLSELQQEQFMLLARECQRDPDSMQILEAYLERMHPEWQHSQDSENTDSAGSTEDLVMNRELALEILGLADDADREEIMNAHRKLMQKMHPDRGGSEYLAKKINAARDFLLEHC